MRKETGKIAPIKDGWLEKVKTARFWITFFVLTGGIIGSVWASGYRSRVLVDQVATKQELTAVKEEDIAPLSVIVNSHTDKLDALKETLKNHIERSDKFQDYAVEQLMEMAKASGAHRVPVPDSIAPGHTP